MKLSCLPVGLFEQITSGNMSVGDWAEIASRAGFDGIDLSALFFKHHEPIYMDRMQQELEVVHMPVAMVTTYPDFTHPDPVQREREYYYLMRDIAAASQIGASYVRVLAGQAHPEVSREDGIRWTVEYLSRVYKEADAFGVVPVYENHAKPSAWFYTDFSHPEDIFLDIVDEMKPNGIRINFDTANPIAANGDTISLLKKVIKLVETVHVADTECVGKLQPIPVGTGMVPLAEVFSLLKGNGYDGWLCIEDMYSKTENDFLETVKRVRNIWENA